MTLNKPARVNSGKSGETIANAILDEAVRAAVKLLRRFDRFYFRCVGEWLSLVEHLVRDQGVGGSNPLSPTNYPADRKAFRDSILRTGTGTWVLFGSNKRFNCKDTRSTARRRSPGTDIT